MSLFATERVPRNPFVVDGVVVPDSVNRTLYVRRPEAESSGYGLLLWRECHMALMRRRSLGGVLGMRLCGRVSSGTVVLLMLLPSPT